MNNNNDGCSLRTWGYALIAIGLASTMFLLVVVGLCIVVYSFFSSSSSSSGTNNNGRNGRNTQRTHSRPSRPARELLLNAQQLFALQDVMKRIVSLMEETLGNPLKNVVNGLVPDNQKVNNKDQLRRQLNISFAKDVFRSYNYLGHEPEIDLLKPEGQCLYIIIRALNREADISADELKQQLTGTDKTNELRRTAVVQYQRQLQNEQYAAGDLDAGQFDLAVSLLYSLLPQNHYENTYKSLFRQLMMIVADADGTITDKERQWIEGIGR